MRLYIATIAFLALAAAAWGHAGIPNGLWPGVPYGAQAGSPGPSVCSPTNGLDYTKTCDTVYMTGIFQ